MVSVAIPTVTWMYTWVVNNYMVTAGKSAGSNVYTVDCMYDVFDWCSFAKFIR